MSAGTPALREKAALFAVRHPRCSISIDECGDPKALVLALEGELDSNDSRDFEEVARLALAESRSSGGLVIELSKLGYVASMGIGALVTILTESKRSGTPLYLRNLPEHAKSILDLLGFLSLFDLIGESRP